MLIEQSRRWFLGAALAFVLPAPARAVGARVPVLCADGTRDDTAALQALLDGSPVMLNGVLIGPREMPTVMNHRFVVTDTLTVNRDYTRICDCVFRVGIDDDRPVIGCNALMVRFDSNRFEERRSSTRRPYRSIYDADYPTSHP